MLEKVPEVVNEATPASPSSSPSSRRTSAIATSLGLSDWVIGVTIIAAGTSVPEFATSLVAVLKGHYGISLGNIIGSDIFNVLRVVGLTGMIRVVEVEASSRLLLLRFAMIVLMTLPDETFSMGRDLTDAVHGLPARGPVRLTVGVVDSIPKLMAHRPVMPALAEFEHLRLEHPCAGFAACMTSPSIC